MTLSTEGRRALDLIGARMIGMSRTMTAYGWNDVLGGTREEMEAVLNELEAKGIFVIDWMDWLDPVIPGGLVTISTPEEAAEVELIAKGWIESRSNEEIRAEALIELERVKEELRRWSDGR